MAGESGQRGRRASGRCSTSRLRHRGGMMGESRILLVEDNADDAELALQALRRNDVKAEIEVVADGVMALERLLDESRPLPDLVLLDLKLPRVDGREVLRVLRATDRTRALPVVMLTSSAESSDL